MEADWSVELAADSPALEIPWKSPDGKLQWLDLRADPSQIDMLPECREHPELAAFLRRVNAPDSPLDSAKCDVFGAEPTGEAESIFGTIRYGGYVDLLFRSTLDFARHEQFARAFTHALDELDSPNGIAELVIRRCWRHPQNLGASEEDASGGLYFSFYLFGIGETEAEAREEWARALTMAADLLSEPGADGMNATLS